jgi:hypothetical protein
MLQCLYSVQKLESSYPESVLSLGLRLSPLPAEENDSLRMLGVDTVPFTVPSAGRASQGLSGFSLTSYSGAGPHLCVFLGPHQSS